MIHLFPENSFDHQYFCVFFLAALGLCCCARAFSSCGEQGLLFVEVRGLLIAVACCGARALGMRASVVVARGLQQLWLTGSRVQAQ